MTDLLIRGLRKSYQAGTSVLNGLELAVPGGQLAAVLGPSGCGKTTMLRIVAGFLRADAGAVTVGGTVLTGPGVHVAPEKRRVGIVPQEGALFPHLTVARNVGFGISGLDRTRRRVRVDEMLDLVGLGGYGDRMPHELSGGQQQRVSLARALAPEPRLVLLDEPFNALDSALRTEVRADVRTALRATGATALLVTHDQQEALSTADLVAVVRNGTVAQCGTPRELYERPADVWVAGFVGDIVRLPGRAANGTADTPLGRLPVTARHRDTGPGHEPAAAPDGTVLLRPEQLRLTDPENAPAQGTVTDIVFYGHNAMVSFTIDGLPTPIEARVPAPVDLRPGQPVGVSVIGEALPGNP